jgi:hypothetical protein
MLKTKSLVSLALALVLTAAGGCIFSPDDDKPCTGADCNPDAGYPFPDSPDQLMLNFKAIYEDMDFAAYAKMIHPDYIMILQQSTQDLYPDVGSTLDVAEELRMHERMFSKQDVTDPKGTLVPGVQTIEFRNFVRSAPWSTSPSTDQIPNAKYAVYNVEFLFDRGQGYKLLKVLGQIKFYVTYRDSVLTSGLTKPYYQMYGQDDLTDSTSP